MLKTWSQNEIESINYIILYDKILHSALVTYDFCVLCLIDSDREDDKVTTHEREIDHKKESPWCESMFCIIYFYLTVCVYLNTGYL